MQQAHIKTQFLLLMFLVFPTLTEAYVINFDTMTSGDAVTVVTANESGKVNINVSFSSPNYTGGLYVGSGLNTTSQNNYLASAQTDPMDPLSIYLTQFMPGDIIRLDFTAPITSLSANFVITSGGPISSPFAISDSASGGSQNSAIFGNIDSTNDYWSIGFNSNIGFTTAYLISMVSTFQFEDTAYPIIYSFNIDDIAFTSVSSIQEPSTLFLIAIGGIGIGSLRSWQNFRSNIRQRK